MSVVRECPECSRRNERVRLAGHYKEYPGLLFCIKCESLYQLSNKEELVPLRALVEKVRLGDDLMSAVSPDTTVSESIHTVIDRYRGAADQLWLGFAGKVTALLAQAETRAHFLVGELAKRTLADNGLESLLETAKQIKDLLSSRPDGLHKPE